MAATVSRERAFLHAHAFFEFSALSATTAPIGFFDFANSRVRDDAVTVFDLSGEELFHEFRVVTDDQVVGGVRVAAQTALGHPWMSIEGAPLTEMATATQLVTEAVATTSPGARVRNLRLVAFNYPRVGVLADYVDAAGAPGEGILDLQFPDAGLLPLSRAEAGLPVSEGMHLYSVLNNLPEAGPDDSPLFEHGDLLLNRLAEFTAPSSFDTLGKAERLNFISSSLRNQPEAETQERILPVPLIQQETQDFCVLASIEMILRFYDRPRPATQQDIQALLASATPPLYAPGGVFPANQTAAFQLCFQGGFAFDLDESPLFEEAKAEIEAARPFKSGIFGHSRVGVGFKEATIVGANGASEVHHYLWINDPSRGTPKLELFERGVVAADNIVFRPVIPIKTNYLHVRPS